MACVTPAELHDPTRLPAGFKFSPTDEQILEYLEDKLTGKLDPLIDEHISTLKEENGICYTHPEKLPGVRKDGQVQYFFHRPSEAYSTGTRKRGRKRTDEDGSKARWQETGNTQPVFIGGITKGFKKILTFGAHYRCHQYHLRNNRENEDNLVVSKVFYLTQPRQCVPDFRGSIVRELAGALVVGLVRALVGALGVSLLRLCWNCIMGSLIMPLTILVTGSKLRASEQELPHKPDDANNNDTGSGSDSSNADESIPKRGKLSQSNSDDGEGSSLSTIATLHHSPTSNQTETGVRRGQRMQAQTTINSGAAHMKNAAVSLQNLVKPVSNHGIVEIHGWGSGSASRSHMVPPSKVQAWGSASCTSLPKPAQPVAFGHMYDASSSGHIFSSSGSGNQAGNFHQMVLPASRPKVEQPWPSDFTGKQNTAPMPAAQNQNPYWWQVPVSPEIAVGAHPGKQNATPRPLDQNQEPGYPIVGIGSVSMNQDMMPPSSLPPAVVQAVVQAVVLAVVQAWGSASCTPLPKPAQAAAFGNFHQMGLPACASCWPKFKQPWASNFTGNQNAASTPAAQNQNPYWRRVPENPEMAAAAHPGNQDATPRPVDQNQERGYPGVGIGPVSMHPNLTILCAGPSTINFNAVNNNNVSAPRI